MKKLKLISKEKNSETMSNKTNYDKVFLLKYFLLKLKKYILLIISKCYSPEQINEIFSLKSSISKQDFRSICPSLLYLKSESLCVKYKNKDHDSDNKDIEPRATNAESKNY